MSQALKAQISLLFNLQEFFSSAPAAAEGGNSLTFDQYRLQAFLHSASYPPIAGSVVDLSKTLSGTTADFDLTAAPLASDPSKTVDKTGFKLVGLFIQTAITNNAAGLTFGAQGMNGYGPWGSVLPTFYRGATQVLIYADPTQSAALTLYTPTVAAGAKDLRWTGTAADVVKCLAIFNG